MSYNATRSKLRDEVAQYITDECAALGFRKRSQMFFTRAITPAAIGVLGLLPRSDGTVYVFPSIAVRHQPLERLVAEWGGEKFHPYLGGTLVTTLHEFCLHLRPDLCTMEDLPWIYFPEGTDNRQTVREMIDIVRTVAVPWMDKYRELSCFLVDLAGYQYGNRDSVRVRRATAYYLSNDFEAARTLALELLHEFGVGDDQVSVFYCRFAQSLLNQLPT